MNRGCVLLLECASGQTGGKQLAARACISQVQVLVLPVINLPAQVTVTQLDISWTTAFIIDEPIDVMIE